MSVGRGLAQHTQSPGFDLQHHIRLKRIGVCLYSQL